MKLAFIDFAIIIAYIVLSIAIGVYYSRRASRNMSEFFIAGRDIPWWVAGTSIVATSFAVDTPLAISGLIRKGGIYENWFWWSMLMGGMLCVFFYARMWRRANVVTDIEFIELRYGGRNASLLRGFMAVYGGVLFNCIVMGWVLLAMAKVVTVLLGWPKIDSVVVFTLVALFYTVMSGFWGVVMTDVVQFVIAMAGSIALAVFVYRDVGGPAGLVANIQALPTFDPKVFHFVPDLATAGKLAVITFIAQITVQWWPKGQGDGYLAQRLFSTRTEEESAWAALWFNYACYVLRPWPWLVVGLASLIYIPMLEDPEMAYPEMIVRFLPIGFRGLMVASLLAAFMSTMDTQLNWGASYLVNDLYKRFIRKNAPDKHYVFVSRVAVIVLATLGGLAAWKSESISDAWKYLAVLTAGTGPVILLRWYWWRINVWSEISALVASFVVGNGKLFAALAHRAGVIDGKSLTKAEWFYGPDTLGLRLFTVVSVCSAVWLTVTYLTRPVSQGHLEQFYRRVRPGGWWAHIARACPEVRPDALRYAWLGWISGVLCVYSGLFGLGYLCLARWTAGTAWLAASFLAGWFMIVSVRVPSTPPKPPTP